jgi:hypothetical protein
MIARTDWFVSLDNSTGEPTTWAVENDSNGLAHYVVYTSSECKPAEPERSQPREDDWAETLDSLGFKCLPQDVPGAIIGRVARDVPIPSGLRPSARKRTSRYLLNS